MGRRISVHNAICFGLDIIKLYMAVMGLLEANVSFKITYYISISTDYIN